MAEEQYGPSESIGGIGESGEFGGFGRSFKGVCETLSAKITVLQAERRAAIRCGEMFA
jgi:hypothetical protein